MSEFVDRTAELDVDGEEDQSVGGSEREELDESGDENHERQSKRSHEQSDGDDNNAIDSSEEEDDDDEEEIAKVREGFIVDDDEDDNENISDAEREDRRRKRRKRRRKELAEEQPTHHRHEDEELDEDDLDLVMENTGIRRDDDRSAKRQKRIDNGLTDIFSDDDKDKDDERELDRRRGALDEFEDFIEDDEFSDEGEAQNESAVPKKPAATGALIRAAIPGVNQEQIGEIFEIFGDGEEYAWALEAEDEEAGEDYAEEQQAAELKDVFEPSELAERLLTDEDNAIRVRDEPERFQIMRKAFSSYELSDEDFALEEEWLVKEISQQKISWLADHNDLEVPLTKAIKKVLEFIVKDHLEVPFIWHHRRDYLLHQVPRKNNDSVDEFAAERLLEQDDLWIIAYLDIKFHSTVERKHSIQKIFKSLEITDTLFQEFFASAKSVEDFQDLGEYINFKYSARLKDVSALSTANGNKTQASAKRPNSRYAAFERIRSGPVYNIVRSFGITAEQFGLNFAEGKKLNFTEDSPVSPLDVSTPYSRIGEEAADVNYAYDTPGDVLDAARQMFSEEIYHDVRVRRFFRQNIIVPLLRISVHATEKGKKTIDDSHSFYRFKYLCNLEYQDILNDPETFIEMFQAESQNLIELKFKLFQFNLVFDKVSELIMSDASSDVAAQWNKERKLALQDSLNKLILLTCKEVKEDLLTKCQQAVGMKCRQSLLDKLDQAPSKPLGFEPGTTPRILTISNGMGDPVKDAAVSVFLDDQGRVVETLQLGKLRDESFKQNLVEIVKRRKPDVLGLAGFTVSSNKLRKEILEIIEAENLTAGAEDDSGVESGLEVIWINDEVARLYQNSSRAIEEFAELAPLVRYCIALGRYAQSPLLEYASMGGDISSIQFHRLQKLLPEELLKNLLDSAFVDMVNLVGVEINEAIKVPYIANLLQYVSGLGLRKASGMLKAIASSPNGYLNDRTELVTQQIVTRNIFMNCASFLRIPWDDQIASYKNTDSTEILDSTRIHPEDYELARKMAADALELDEEDLVDLENQGGVVAQLMEDDPEKLNELILEEYAEELRKNFNQRKRATLEMIKEELQHHFQELRKPFRILSDEQVFSMLTGETPETLASGVVVPVNIRKVGDRFLVARLACGLDGNISALDMTDRKDIIHPSSLFYFGQTLRAVITNINYQKFEVDLSTIESQVEHALKKSPGASKRPADPSKWDDYEEDKDILASQSKREKEEKQNRVVKHQLFKPFNAKQAEEYLAPLHRGDLVIRPSSKGFDHIAITWKVAEGVFQHIAVLELEKENDYSLGKILRIGDHNYSDLDELIFAHVQSMVRKVDEMMASEKFQKGSRADVERWLTTYTEANPRRSNYAFCLDTRHPGYFNLCFKAGQKAAVVSWPVKVIPNGYQLNGFQMQTAMYPTVPELCNGFKRMFGQQLEQQKRR
ncbi:SH2 domain-containing protein [Lipomyces japonicus]|uniref:SH2 domain-containing protein n=1 Tax=Lipomyces japonicus TaxID=56871 RepID=UPI0034CDD422